MPITTTVQPPGTGTAGEPQRTSKQERDEQRREAQRALQRSLESRW